MESPVLVDVASASIIVFSSVFSPAPGLMRAPQLRTYGLYWDLGDEVQVTKSKLL